MLSHLLSKPELPNPSYIQSEFTLEENLKLLSRVQTESGAHILAALKGYAYWSSFPLLKNYLSGLTASSLNEVRLCNEEYGEKAHACFVVYQKEEFKEVLASCSHITFNSLSQYEQFKEEVLSHPDINFAIRINPEYSASEVDKYNTCMPGSRFGVLSKDFPEKLPEGITGLHFHALCENQAEDLEDLLKEVEQKFGHLLSECKWVNFGGGHHITKKGYDVALLNKLIIDFRLKYDVVVFLEPGEAIGWRTGYLLCRVEDVIENAGQKVAILNVSFSAHMPDCLEMPYKPAVIGELRADDPKAEAYTLGGNTCMSGDFIEGFYFEKQLNVGDKLLFEDMMHYSFVKSTTFNGVPLPSLLTLNKNGEVVHQKDFSYSDYKGRLS